MRLALKLAAVSMVVVSIGLQVYILFLALFELFTIGGVFVSIWGYGASLMFSLPAYFVANVLIYGAKISLPMKWIHCTYFGSHLIILICAFAFPGKFGH